MDKYPAKLLVPAENGIDTVMGVDIDTVDWTRSYAEIEDTQSIAQNEILALGIYYR